MPRLFRNGSETDTKICAVCAAFREKTRIMGLSVFVGFRNHNWRILKRKFIVFIVDVEDVVEIELN